MNIDELIESKTNQIKLLQNEKRRLLNQKKKREEKERERRLLEWGLMLESLLENPEQYNACQMKVFLEMVFGTPQAKAYFHQMQLNDEVQ